MTFDYYVDKSGIKRNDQTSSSVEIKVTDILAGGQSISRDWLQKELNSRIEESKEDKKK